MHTIKLYFTNNNTITTRINGNEKEIYKHYQDNNIFNWRIDEPQIKKIEFLESLLLENRSSLKYIFVDYQNNGLLQ